MTAKPPQSAQDEPGLTGGPEAGVRPPEALQRAATDTPGLLAALPQLAQAECHRRNLSQRAAAKELGLGPSTITRIIQGHGCDARALLTLITWLDLASTWLTSPDKTLDAYQRGWADCAAHMQAALAAVQVGNQP